MSSPAFELYGSSGILRLGWPHGRHQGGSDVEPAGQARFYRGLVPPEVQGDSYGLGTTPVSTVRLYENETNMVTIPIRESDEDMLVLGLASADDRYAPLIADVSGTACNLLWGFEGRPEEMSNAGRRLLVDVVRFGLDNCPEDTS